MDTLDNILRNAPAAFPQALAVGKTLVEMEEGRFYAMRDKVEVAIPGIEQRISMQYALTLVATQQVRIHSKHPSSCRSLIYHPEFRTVDHASSMQHVQCTVYSERLKYCAFLRVCVG